MRKRLQIALMATPVIAASLSRMPTAMASDSSSATSKLVATTDDSGRTIYTNEYVAAPSSTEIGRAHV